MVKVEGATMIVLYCSFCGRAATDVAKLVAGPGVYICNDCVTACGSILASDDARGPAPLVDSTSLTDDQLLDSLSRTAQTTANVEADLRARVDELRSRGVAWTAIGAALGVAKQTAWERFTERG